MKKFLFISSFILLCPFIGLSQFFHVDVIPSLQGTQLLEALVENYKPQVVLGYGDARDAMYSDIDNQNDYVSGIYSDHTLYLDPDAEPRAFLFMNGADDGINAEHSYPQSKGASSGNARSDIHHLYPSRVFVNSARGSKPFQEIADSDTDNWFFENQNLTNIPNSSIDSYSENDANAFEPREEIKGDIARSIMYFYTMYKTEADNADPVFFENQKETLCQWHFDDPVDSLEYARTFKIASYQQNKANPFVLDCSVASRTFCDMTSDLCEKTVSIGLLPIASEIILYPNPSSTSLTLDFEDWMEDISIEIYTISGQKRMAQTFKKKKSITIHHELEPAFYICSILYKGYKVNKPFIVNK